MNDLTILIKPASGLCNLQCKYCFYNDVMNNRNIHDYGLMEDATAEELIRKAFLESPITISFIFQGGEPTLIGLEFYKFFVKTVNSMNTSNITVNYSIQTNGVLIDSNYAKFFKKNNFLVGVSLDGNKYVHDCNRLSAKDTGSFDQVVDGINNLKKMNVDFNLLTVVTQLTVDNIEVIYEFLSNLGTQYLQFIPCFDTFDSKESGSTLSSDNYLKFLKKVFDIWYDDIKNDKLVSIRYFDDIISIMMDFGPSSCSLSGQCIPYVTVEADGSVYPCDFYVLDEFKLGNIFDSLISEMLLSNSARNFNNLSVINNDDCQKCKYFKLCKGGCRRNKDNQNSPGKSKTRYCDAYYKFLEYSIDRFQEVTRLIKQNSKLD